MPTECSPGLFEFAPVEGRTPNLFLRTRRSDEMLGLQRFIFQCRQIAESDAFDESQP